MAGNISESYEQLASTDMWEDVLYVFLGFFAPVLFGRLVEGVGASFDFNIYDELYGVFVIVAAEFLMEDSDDIRRQVQLGGGLYAVDRAAERYNIKSKIEGMI